jgi:hypothetical protein
MVLSPEVAMSQTSAKLTFKDYLTYDDGKDNRYELVDGKLVIVPLPTGKYIDLSAKIQFNKNIPHLPYARTSKPNYRCRNCPSNQII